jgi:hypothetical protein
MLCREKELPMLVRSAVVHLQGWAWPATLHDSQKTLPVFSRTHEEHIMPAESAKGKRMYPEKHMQPPRPPRPRRLLALTMEGKSRSGGSRSSTITEVSSFRPPCAR